MNWEKNAGPNHLAWIGQGIAWAGFWIGIGIIMFGFSYCSVNADMQVNIPDKIATKNN